MKKQRRFFNLKLNNEKHFGARLNNEKHFSTSLKNNKFFNAVMEFLKINFKFKTNENISISGIYRLFRYRKLEEFDPHYLEDLDNQTLDSMDKEEL